MRKLFFRGFFVLFIFLFIPAKTFASDNFLTSYDVTYTISESGNTHITFAVSLENTTENWYASSYKIGIGFQNIKNVVASDADGLILPTINKTDFGQNMELALNKKAVGLGKIASFNLSFDTPNVAKKNGNIWEINIPGITNQNSFSRFNVHLKVPSSFGEPAYIKPPQETLNLDFTKEQLGKSGISIAFGKKQTYSFSLNYHLKNPNLYPIETEIAIPPSTNNQDVFIDDINPKPINVIEDKDGNWLAKYRLMPSQKLNIEVNGKSQLFLYPHKQEISDREFSEYLKEKPYWEINDSKIKQLASSLKTPAAIYNYVIKTLTYDFSRVTDNKPRLGAKKVLDNPSSAVCLEFTDLFIALARASGIPAREVDGFALTDNSKQRPLSLVKDILHAWPQYYDKDLQTWIMVDPTWGNTTEGVDYLNVLDFDHFSFVVKGYNSGYPIPPGGYKISGYENVKDVHVDFIENIESEKQNMQVITTGVPSKVISGVPINASIKIKNIGKTILMPQEVIVETDFLNPKYQKISYSKIPPFGSIDVPISFEKLPFLTSRKAIVKIHIGGKTFYETIAISPFFISNRNFLIGGGIFICAILTIILSIAARKIRSLYFSKQKG